MSLRPLYLSLAEMAQVTGGYWENMASPAFTLTGISLDKNTTQSGDVYFRLQDQRAAAGIKVAERNGAVAAVANRNAVVEGVSIAVLRVEDPDLALKQIAAVTRDACHAQKVLVTGSYGKTGFKTQLYHVLKGQLSTHAILNSNNSLKAIWKSLATLHPDDAVTVIEVAVPSLTRGEVAAKCIQPHLCVITWIGHEHLLQNGGTQAHIIANKAKVVLGLPPDGTVIIPQQAEVFAQLVAEIRRLRSDVNILVFGETESCHAQLIAATFQSDHWLVTARIAHETLYYSLPLWEHYAPLSSISVLLAASYLGVNLDTAAKQFATYRNYKSSGNVYELERAGKRFFLYDQSTRIGIEAFKSTLKLIATLKPANQGRKIAVFTEFYSLDKAPKDVLNIALFQQLFQQAGLDCLYTASNFTEHIKVLPDKNIWKNHSDRIENLIDEITADLQQDDMLFVRGAVEEGEVGLDRLVDSLLKNSRIVKAFY